LPLSGHRPIGASAAPAVLDHYARAGLYLSDVAVVTVLLSGLFLPSGHSQVKGRLRLSLPLLVLIALALVSIPGALSHELASYTALRWALAVGVYLILLRRDWSLENWTDRERWVKVLAVGLGIHTLIGIGQVLLQRPLGLPGELAMEAAQPGAAVLSVAGQRWLRAYGLTFHPNVLGGFLAVGLLLSLPLLQRHGMRLLWWLMGLGLLLTFSRSAWLSVAVMLPLLAGWLAWHRPALRRALAITLGSTAMVLLVSSLLLAGQLFSRLRPSQTASESRSLRERGELISAALDIIADQPLTGIGAGNFSLALIDGTSSMRPQPVHNVPLLLASEVGVGGGGLWLWLWLAPALALGRRQSSPDPWPVVLAGTWFAWGIIGLWDSYPWALNAGRLLSITLLGLTHHALES
jgi:O-antigen ligase